MTEWSGVLRTRTFREFHSKANHRRTLFFVSSQWCSLPMISKKDMSSWANKQALYHPRSIWNIHLIMEIRWFLPSMLWLSLSKMIWPLWWGCWIFLILKWRKCSYSDDSRKDTFVKLLLHRKEEGKIPWYYCKCCSTFVLNCLLMILLHFMNCIIEEIQIVN